MTSTIVSSATKTDATKTLRNLLIELSGYHYPIDMIFMFRGKNVFNHSEKTRLKNRKLGKNVCKSKANI